MVTVARRLWPGTDRLGLSGAPGHGRGPSSGRARSRTSNLTRENRQAQSHCDAKPAANEPGRSLSGTVGLGIRPQRALGPETGVEDLEQ